MTQQTPDNRYDDEIDLFQLFSTLWKGKLVILGLILVSLITVGMFLFLTPSKLVLSQSIEPLGSVKHSQFIGFSQSAAVRSIFGEAKNPLEFSPESILSDVQRVLQEQARIVSTSVDRDVSLSLKKPSRGKGLSIQAVGIDPQVLNNELKLWKKNSLEQYRLSMEDVFHQYISSYRKHLQAEATIVNRYTADNGNQLGEINANNAVANAMTTEIKIEHLNLLEEALNNSSLSSPERFMPVYFVGEPELSSKRKSNLILVATLLLSGFAGVCIVLIRDQLRKRKEA